MASADLHFTDKDVEVNTIATTFEEEALKSPHILSDIEEVSSDLLQHTNSSRCVQACIDNTDTQITSSDLEETGQGRNNQEDMHDINVSECIEVSAAIAEENKTAGKKQDITVDECEGTKCDETGNNINVMEVENPEKDLLKEELKCLQCPFTWNLNFKDRTITTEKVIANCNDKLNLVEIEDKDEDEEHEWWYRFIQTLVLCHEQSIITSSSDALTKLQECEDLISKCQSNDKPNVFFQNIKEAVLHVINASKCHLLVSLNMFNEAMELMKGITRHEDMNKQNMAAIFGIRSAMLMEYAYEGTKAALEYAEKAVSLDGNEGEWNLLYGKLLGRIRRVEKIAEIPTHEELSALEQAVAKTRSASRVIFLAQAYREAATKAFQKHHNNIDTLRDTINKMKEKSLQLYWEALTLNGNSARVNIRCAAGLLKLPRPFQDLKKAEECIEKALKIAPNNPMSHHVAGMVYEKVSKFDLAEKFYKNSAELGVYGAYMDLMKLKFSRDRKYDPMPVMESMLQQFRENVQIQDIYLQMGSFQFYCKNDILAALDYWMKGIEKDPDSHLLKTHKSSFLIMYEAVNLYQVIADETQLALKQGTHTDENILKLRNMLHYCKERCPDLLSNEPRNWREQNFRRRSKNQRTGREGDRWCRGGQQEKWRGETRKETKSTYRTPSTYSRSHGYRNTDQSRLQQHQNWRSSPRSASDSAEDNKNLYSKRNY